MGNSTFYRNHLFELLNINSEEQLLMVAKRVQIKKAQLKYYNDKMICPLGEDLDKICSYLHMSEREVKIRLGVVDFQLVDWIIHNPQIVLESLHEDAGISLKTEVKPIFCTNYGQLYNCDCLDMLSQMNDESVDLVFADPPFNLAKKYSEGFNDNISKQEYLRWTEEWLKECVRVLKPGGAFFVYNIPQWLTDTSNILNRYLNFRHWIAIYMRGLMPVQNKLHPAHYGLLYYIKGDKPRVFNQQRIPMPTCRHCGGEIHDYGGKKSGLDPKGLSIADVWNDINPVRHLKYKNRAANELPIKLLYRILSLASDENDIVLDPFGGSGTTYAVAEYLKRRWIGSEIGDIDCIIDRLENSRDTDNLKLIEKSSNVLFTEGQIALRRKNNYWTYEILKQK